ncbi:MAG: aminomethyl-transferring glycine dehydrogenase subunit GcvPA [Coriobacteriia bacterium]|nr:aminomethyl-transferring glycine dehydrogenase subunit GcvPA [Coriobacteriia bacterium]
MLDAIGVADFDELIGEIPESIRLDRELEIGGGLDELELSRFMRSLASKNINCTQLISFAGAGCYDHYIPSCIDHILRKPEFFTAYTPYQPEFSQGTLQAIFEYQTSICILTGMQVANASMYDGATALAEAALMTVRASRNKRTEILASQTLHPQYLEVLDTYALSGLMQVRVVSFEDLAEAIDENTASILVGYPNFIGAIENIASVITSAHEKGSLAVVCANPMMLALLDSPGSLGADIVVGEAQCFGNPQSFGGPGLGYFAATDKLMRLMPGRIVGRTTDVDGKDGFVLTLSTREQHIRREKATSNICSNHALNALAAGAYLRYVGGDGLLEIALTCVQKAHRLSSELMSTGLFEPAYEDEYGYEFALTYLGEHKLEKIYNTLVEQRFLPGVLIDDKTILIAVTEKRTEEEIDAFVKAVRHAA